MYCCLLHVCCMILNLRFFFTFTLLLLLLFIFSQVFREIKIEGFNPAQFEMKQVFYPSKDGTKIPMFIVHGKDMKMDGTAPTLLYGYGGFNISIQPYFSVSRVIFMQLSKGVLAIPNIRGGGWVGFDHHPVCHKRVALVNPQMTGSPSII